jgi:anti-sigma28 factor (negative regulator of flagellin synthesis)
MEIRSTSADDPNSNSERIDITRKNREAIQARQPLMPKPEEPAPARDPNVQAKAVLAARELHRAQHQERIANARLDYTANQTEAHAKDVSHARDLYEARIEQAIARRVERAGLHKSSPTADKLEISDASQRLSQLDAASHAVDQARAQRIADLRQLFQNGALDTDQRIARAAQRLLGGE